MATKVLKDPKHRWIKSTTDPNDPDAVPAFETSAGVKSGPGKKPVMVNKHALANYTENVDPAVKKFQMEAANVAALFAKKAIRPDEIAALRRRMFEVVADGLEDVSKVIKGEKQWNNVQVRLFSILTERVMPKLSTITVEDTTSKKLDDMSIEELEAIALGKKNHEAVDAVVKHGQELDQKAEAAESREFNTKTKRIVTKIASINDAELAYIDKKTGKTKPKEGFKLKKPRKCQESSSAILTEESERMVEPSETSGEAKE